ncbi:MAG: hypothetical protein FWD45_01710 [Coriobacteriia bacterium]|nr:hypothetical protein [Coriobacteriia bacterium]
MALRDTILPSYSTDTYDVYELDQQLLLVAHDRLYINEQKISDQIENKGRAVMHLAVYWYELFEAIIDTNFVSADVADLPKAFEPYADELHNRFMLTAKVDEYPIRAQVLGYLTDQVIDEYQSTSTVGGVDTEPGLVLNSKLEQVIFIPYLLTEGSSTGEQIDLFKTIELFEARDAMVLCSNALELYEIIHSLALSLGVVFVDINLRFGSVDNRVVLASVPTADNSLLWQSEVLQADQKPTLYLQEVYDWLASDNNQTTQKQLLPAALSDLTSKRLIELSETITRESLAD